ncbi:aegerolysin family protein [Streptosporangium sp. NPDC020072]|uniref:aegerolysin family protein n=1 Tax=unclassified Streptosporangium TaxID=2632669 RepID=UPI0034368571
MKLVTWTLVGIAAVALLTPVTAHASSSDSAANAARSTKVVFHNDTDCTLTQIGKETYHGIWVIEPNSSIAPHSSDYFKTESDGVLTGTEAAIKYRADNCSRAGKQVRFHWDNPYYGRNSYDFDGTDGAFTTRYTGGNGDNATVDAHVS